MYVESEMRLLDQPNVDWINSAAAKKAEKSQGKGGHEGFMGASIMIWLLHNLV